MDYQVLFIDHCSIGLITFSYSQTLSYNSIYSIHSSYYSFVIGLCLGLGVLTIYCVVNGVVVVGVVVVGVDVVVGVVVGGVVVGGVGVVVDAGVGGVVVVEGVVVDADAVAVAVGAVSQVLLFMLSLSI